MENLSPHTPANTGPNTTWHSHLLLLQSTLSLSYRAFTLYAIPCSSSVVAAAVSVRVSSVIRQHGAARVGGGGGERWSSQAGVARAQELGERRGKRRGDTGHPLYRRRRERSMRMWQDSVAKN